MNFMEDNIAQKKSNIIGAAITGGASLIGGAIDAITTSRQNKLNREAQRKENERSRQWQEEMYNKYSSPAAQVHQRAAAGLNPYNDGAVSSQSVGSASTGSIPAGQAPAIGESIANAGGAIGNYIMNRSIYKGYQLDNEQKEVNIQNSYQDLIRKAMENEDYSAVRQYKIDEIKYSSEYASASLKEKRQLIRKARYEADQLEIEAKWKKDAAAAGVNSIVDSHNESIARINSITQDIQNKNTQNEADKFALSVSKMFTTQFMELNLKAREKEVEEFLDTSETRVSLYHAQKGFARLAMNAAERNDALSEINNETQKIIAENILDAAKDGKTSLDAVLIKYFAQDPASAISALSHLSNFAPDINNKNYNTNVSYY